jgi:hypothetical protein
MFLTTALAVTVGFTLPPVPTVTKNFLQDYLVTERGRAAFSSSEIPSRVAEVTQAASMAVAAVPRAIGLSPIDAIEAELHSYLQFSAGWDGEGSRGAKWNDVKFAVSILQRLPAGVPLPKAMLSSSGEIGFYWNSKNAFVDLMIEENGTFSLFAKLRGDHPQERFVDGLQLRSDDMMQMAACLALIERA